MRFLMLNWRDMENPKHGGAERVTQGYLAALAQRGHEVYWYSEAFEGCAPTAEMDGVKVVRGGRNIVSRMILARKWYRRQPRFDLVIDQHHGVPWYAPWWCKTNCISYIHEVLGSIWGTFYKGWRAPVAVLGPMQERLTLRLYRNVPFWTACESTEKALRANGVRYIKRIPYGVHTVALPYLEPKKLGTPLKLAFVSRLAPNKRVDHAIRAVQILSQKGIDVHLKVAGGGDSYNDLKRLVADLRLENIVEFTGFISEEEKNAMLKETHFLLHTSVREGWGLNVIEANAMGTPTAVYPAEGLTESTLKDVTGIISDEQTPESLAECILSHLNDQAFYDRIRVAAWERAKTFHWSQVLPLACDWLESQAKK